MISILSLLSLIFTIVYVIVVLFLNRGWQRLRNFTFKDIQAHTKVSILIAARNEEDKIALTIDDILKQQYPKELFELIIVDDHSTDHTAQIIASYASQGVKLIQLNESEPLNSYKKKAIAEAIKTATGELIITTDADCRMSSLWLATIVNYYNQHGYKLISSPVAYFEEKSFFERLQTLEFSFLIGLGAAGIGNQMPSTCNGANLAYRKDVFEELGGFKGIDDLASGDDELFLHKVAFAYPESIGFCKSYDAIVFTHAKENLKSFIQQRKRWASKSVKYKDKRIVALAISVWISNLSLISHLLFVAFIPSLFPIFIIQYLLKMGVELWFLYPVLTFNKRRSLLILLPFLTLLHPLYFIYIGIAGNSGKYNWKGRMVR
ncbi:glycosyltransferase family 2 protein [Pedobacter glucosidilyticus]|uniref:glycosyltransferase family 2 protein n=1 Tax=Pedobacter glucosidilyticus TaxID=1122941 RepID=UPI0026F25EAE|nr:glycosyltransferase [Pedobacter glucosidilyticus]